MKIFCYLLAALFLLTGCSGNNLNAIGVNAEEVSETATNVHSGPPLTFDFNEIENLKGLYKIDWLRNNTECWMGRAIKPNGKINRNEQGIYLTYIQIKRLLDLPISQEELRKESL